MQLLRLTPTNLTEEKQRFFSQAHHRYNPQFEYAQAIDPAVLDTYGVLNSRLVEHAYQMLEKYPVVANDQSQAYSPQELEIATQNIAKETGLPNISLFFSEEYLSGFLLNSAGLHIKLPILLKNSEELAGKLNHEIQTHYLRRHNGKQTGYKTTDKLACKFTEEGLANIHSFIETSDPIMRKNYLNYIASHVAQDGSFTAVFETLKSFGMDDELAWTQTVKVKRGLADTSQSGGSTLAKTYLEGSIQVGQWIKSHNPIALFAGRISLHEAENISPEKLEELETKIIKPTFFNSVPEYQKMVARVLEANGLDSFVV